MTLVAVQTVFYAGVPIVLGIYGVWWLAFRWTRLVRKAWRDTASDAKRAKAQSDALSQYNFEPYINIEANLAKEPCSYCQKPRGARERCEHCGAPAA